MVRVDLFAADGAHDRFCRPLIERIAREAGHQVVIRVPHSAGDIGPAQTELRAYMRALARGLRTTSMPDLLCVAIDASCHGHARRRRELE